MKTLDDFFHTSADIPVHPRLRHWKERLARPGVKAALELYRPPTVLGLVQTDMNLQFTENGQPPSLETLPWEDLNTGLIHLSVRAVNPEQESERFALGLRGALRRAGREVGDGYLSSVLLDFIEGSELARYPEIGEVLRHAYAPPPNREGKAAKRYELCREMISDAISGRARELTAGLGYSEEEAKPILLKALARYLDERFSVTNRRRLGLL